MADFDPKAYLASKQNQVAASDFDPKAYLAAKGQQTQSSDPSLWQEAKNAGKAAIDYGLRGLDYAGGLTRTGATDLVDTVKRNSTLSNDKPLVTGDDWLSALQGKAPSTSEYMDRAGVGEGPKVDLMPEIHIPETRFTPGVTLGKGSTSARDVGGFIGDVALDPLTWATMGTSALDKVGGNVAGRGVEAVGDASYRSAFKPVDEFLKSKGKTPLSEVLMENGRPSGKTSTISNAIYGEGGIANQKASARKGIYDELAANGITGDGHYAMENARNTLADISDRSPPLRKNFVPDMNEMIESYANEGKVPIERLSDWKSDLYDALPPSSFGPNGKVRTPAKQVQAAMANGLKTEIEGAGDALRPGLGQEISGINDEWGSLLSANKPLSQMVKSAAKKNAVTPVDAAIAYFSHFDPVAMGLKKGADIAKTTAARTMVGNGLSHVGTSGLVDPILRRKLIGMDQSPYDRLASPQKPAF